MEQQPGNRIYDEEPITDSEYLTEISLNPQVKAEVEAADRALMRYIPDQAERMSEVRRQMERLLSFARIDGLTGLKNQTGFRESLAQELKRMSRFKAPTSLLFLDLDRFKLVNDRYGHPAGDAALVAVANWLKEQLRPSDTIGRLGGDELGIVLPAIGIGSVAIANRLQTSISGLQIPGFPEANGILGVSIGVAISAPGEGPEEIYARADQGTLWSKVRGRGTTSVMPTPGMPQWQIAGARNVHFISPNAGRPPEAPR